MTTQTKEHNESSSSFSNQHLKVEVSRKPGCRVIVDITVSPDGASAAYEKAIKNVKKEVSIPGFRKGRAPTAMILSNYQKAISSEFQDVALQTAFGEALALADVHPLKKGYVSHPKVKECSPEKGVHFSVELEEHPIVPSINLDGLTIEKVAKPALNDEEVDNALWQVQMQFVTYEEVEDRPVQEGDFVDVSVTLLVDSPQKAIDHQRTQVSSKGLPKWLLGKIIGVESGQSVEGTTEASEEEGQSDFKPLPYQLTVHKIYQGTFPEKNDELATRVGLKSLDELTQQIKERLGHQLEEEFYRAEVKKLEERLFDEYAFAVPASTVEARASHYLHQFMQSEQRSNVGAKELDKLKKDFELHSEKMLVLSYLLSKIGFDHQIQVNEDDVKQELLRQIALIPSGQNSVDIYSKNDNLRQEIHDIAFTRKVKQFLLDHAKRA